jgi:hypothetical protein
MYNTVYKDIIKCGAAIKLEKEVLVNLKGKIVSNTNESDGLATQFIITNPKLIVLVDETGSNINQ